MRFPCVVLFVFSGVRFNGIVVVVVLGCFVFVMFVVWCCFYVCDCCCVFVVLSFVFNILLWLVGCVVNVCFLLVCFCGVNVCVFVCVCSLFVLVGY